MRAPGERTVQRTAAELAELIIRLLLDGAVPALKPGIAAAVVGSRIDYGLNRFLTAIRNISISSKRANLA